MENLATFSLERFLAGFDDYSKIGIELSIDGFHGGDMIITPSSVVFHVETNTRYLYADNRVRVLDFNWYMMNMKFIYEKFSCSFIVCEQTK